MLQVDILITFLQLLIQNYIF